MSKLEINPGQVTEVPLSVLFPDPDQPRQTFSEVPLQELADDINLRGVQDPIKIRQGDEGKLLIVEGERRFRASQLALKETIPCLLKPSDDKDKTPEVTRLLGQVKENHLRENLNPMEWAGFLKKLRDDHKIKTTEMEAFLKQNAIHNMSRSYISNLIRLVDLPEWAQTLISNGTLTAAHGKHLLAAKASNDVMEEVKASIDLVEDLSDYTTSDLEGDVFDSFRAVTTNLGGASFDIDDVCKKCQSKKKMKSGWGGEFNFCLNEKCFNDNQAKAKAASASGSSTSSNSPSSSGETKETRKPPTTAKVNKQGVVDLNKNTSIDFDDDMRLIDEADFNRSDCADCKHNKKASGDDIDMDSGEDEGTLVVKQVCFDVACFDDKAMEEEAEQERLAPFINYLSAGLRKHIIIHHVVDDTTLQLNLLGFMAIGFPLEVATFHGSYASEDNENLTDKDISETLDIKNLSDILKRGAMSNIVEIARDGVLNMGSRSLGMLASHLEIKLENFLITDEPLLKLFDKKQLIKLNDSSRLIITESEQAAWEAALKGKADDLFPFFKDETLTGENTPPEILTAWKRLTDPALQA